MTETERAAKVKSVTIRRSYTANEHIVWRTEVWDARDVCLHIQEYPNQGSAVAAAHDLCETYNLSEYRYILHRKGGGARISEIRKCADDVWRSEAEIEKETQQRLNGDWKQPETFMEALSKL